MVKKLNLNEMWELYGVLKEPIQSGKHESLLIDEIIRILDASPPGTLIACLNFMYDNIKEDISPTEASVLFVRGLKENNFFSFMQFMDEVNGRTK